MDGADNQWGDHGGTPMSQLGDMIQRQEAEVAALIQKLEGVDKGIAIMQRERADLVADIIHKQGKLEGLQQARAATKRPKKHSDERASK